VTSGVASSNFVADLRAAVDSDEFQTSLSTESGLSSLGEEMYMYIYRLGLGLMYIYIYTYIYIYIHIHVYIYIHIYESGISSLGEKLNSWFLFVGKYIFN
jgi:hypothetical protein